MTNRIYNNCPRLSPNKRIKASRPKSAPKILTSLNKTSDTFLFYFQTIWEFLLAWNRFYRIRMLHANTSQWHEKSVLLFRLTVRIQLSKHQPLVPYRVYKPTWKTCLGLPGGQLHPQPGCPKAFNWGKLWHLGSGTDLRILILSRICSIFFQSLSIQPAQNEFSNIADCYKCTFPAARNCIFLLCSLPVKEDRNNFRVSWKVLIKAASRRLFSN